MFLSLFLSLALAEDQTSFHNLPRVNVTVESTRWNPKFNTNVVVRDEAEAKRLCDQRLAEASQRLTDAKAVTLFKTECNRLPPNTSMTRNGESVYYGEATFY